MIAVGTLPARAAELTATLAEMSIALTALIAVAALFDRALRRSGRPHLRLVPWLLVIARPLIPLTLVATLGGWIGLAEPLLPNLAGVDGTIESTTSVLGVGDHGADPAHATDLASLLLAIAWGTGVFLLAAAVVVRTARTRRDLLSRSSARDGDLPAEWHSAAEDARRAIGLRRTPSIAIVRDLSSPLVLGFLRPVVMIPTRLTGPIPAEQDSPRHILLHEFAHLHRRDPWLGALSTLVGIAFWFHPLVWIARRRITELVELCADARVAAVLGEETPAYRSTLLRLAAQIHGVSRPTPPATGALGLLNSRAAIITRLEALERSHGERGRSLATTGSSVRSIEPSVLDGRALAAEILASDPPGCLLGRYAAFAQLGPETTSDPALPE